MSNNAIAPSDAAQASRLLSRLLDMAEAMLNAGAEVNRVEDTLTRMGTAYGASRMNVFVITSSVVITMQFADGSQQTQTRRIRGGGSTDFTLLEQLNALSRRYCAAPFDPSVLKEELHALYQQPRSRWTAFVGHALATGGFALFFGGSAWDCLAAALFGLLLCLMQRRLAPLCENRVVFNLLCSLLLGLVICGVCLLLPVLHTDMIIIGVIMPLIPGLAMTNAIRDMLAGDTISGTLRLTESLLLAGVLAGGFMLALRLMGGAV